MDNAFRPTNVFRDFYQSWWIIVVCMMFGAIGGGIINIFKPPVFEAQVTFTVSIDYVKTGRMTNIEEDHMIGVVGAIIQSSAVMEEVVKQARTEGSNINIETFLESTSTERQFYNWLLRVRSTDKMEALRLAEFWGSIAKEKIQVGLLHVSAAQELSQTLDLLESCLQGVIVEPISGLCNMGRLKDIQEKIQMTRQLSYVEKLESLGLNPGIMITKTQSPTLSSKPILYGQNLLIFSGGIIGLVCAVSLIWVFGSRNTQPSTL